MGEIFSADDFFNIGNQPESQQRPRPRVRPTNEQPIDSQEYYEAEPPRRSPVDPRAINLPPMGQWSQQPRRAAAPRPQAAPPRPTRSQNPNLGSNSNYDTVKPPTPEKKERSKKRLSRKAIAWITGVSVVLGVAYAGDLFGVRENISATAANIFGQPIVDHDPGVNTSGLDYRGEVSLSMTTGTDTAGSCLAENSAILYADISGHMPLIPNLPLKATDPNKKPAAQPVSRYLTGKDGAINIDPGDAKPVDPKDDPNDVEGNNLFQIENDKSLTDAKKQANEKITKDFWAKSDNGYPEATINNIPLALHVCESGTGSAVGTTKDKYGNVTGITVNRSNLTLNFMAPPTRSFLAQTDGVDNAVKNLNQKQGQYETLPVSGTNLFLQQGAASPYDSTELGNLVTAYSANQGVDYASQLFVQMEINAVQQIAAERGNPDMFSGEQSLQDMTDLALSKVLAKGGVKVTFTGNNYKFGAGDASSVINKATASATPPKDLYLQDLSMKGQPDTKIFEFDGKPKFKFGYFVQPKVTSPTPTATSTPKPTATPTK